VRENEIKELKPGDRVRLTTKEDKVRHYVVQSVEGNQVVCQPLNHAGGTAYIHAFSAERWVKD
jgi:FKBP-type peptidyl-prolyl cis-trans isomerase 2